jgi:hypothetical protein
MNELSRFAAGKGFLQCTSDCNRSSITAGTWMLLERVHIENCLEIETNLFKNYFVVRTEAGEPFLSVPCTKFLVNADPPVVID